MVKWLMNFCSWWSNWWWNGSWMSALLLMVDGNPRPVEPKLQEKLKIASTSPPMLLHALCLPSAPDGEMALLYSEPYTIWTKTQNRISRAPTLFAFPPSTLFSFCLLLMVKWLFSASNPTPVELKLKIAFPMLQRSLPSHLPMTFLTSLGQKNLKKYLKIFIFLYNK